MHLKRALIIKQNWLNKILSGEKTWEIRGRATNIRGKIGLIQSGSGLIMGECELIDCKKISMKDFKSNKNLHCIADKDGISYKQPYAWIIKNPKKYNKPIPYSHPKGAIVWVLLP